jgi:hypothetical protein
MEVNDEFHAPRRFTPGDTARGTHCVGGKVDSRAGLDFMEKTKISNFGRQVRNPSLYRLSYKCSIKSNNLLVLNYLLISHKTFKGFHMEILKASCNLR